MTTIAVKHYNWGMQGAPQLANAWGDMTALLDAVLVDGFNLRTIDTLTFADGIATVGLNEGVLAINTKTRQKEWSLITNPPAGRPTIVDGVLFIGLSNNPVAMTATTMPAEKLAVPGLHAIKLKP